MASAWTSERFPQFEKPLLALTEQHRELEDQPLHLAVSYGPPRDQEDIFLFEVVGGTSNLNPDRDLFEVTYLSVPGFWTGFAQPLHLVLTTPAELKVALDEGWPLAKEFVDAVRAGAYKVLFKDAVGQRLWRQVRAAAKRAEEATHG